MKKFNYISDYKRFKPKNKVKVTFLDDGKIVTKNVEILAINDKNISFKDAKYTYKCNSAAIKNIRKRLNFMILFTLILLILILVGYMFLAFFDRIKRYYTDKNIERTDFVGAQSFYGDVLSANDWH